MSAQTPEQEAPQRRPRKSSRSRRPSVLSYLIILFAVAFLLLMLAYFQQQRINSEATNDALKQSASAVQSLNILMEENQSLKEQLEQKEQELAAAEQKALDNLEAAGDKEQVTVAMNQLNTLRALYNQSRYREARGFLSELGETGQAQVRTLLEEAASLLSQEDRAIYDPLNAWDQLVSWLR